ncbi:MAG: hypothetical protein L0227_11010 [Chloroflexi bacterium]|nr:hypothetical protein [Chloroflexota bacterium]
MTWVVRDATVNVSDGQDAPPIEALFEDLGHHVHDSAVAHYGYRPGCRSAHFAREEGGRDGFATALRVLGCPDGKAAEYLGEWDACSRPVAVIHWWERFEPDGPVH